MVARAVAAALLVVGLVGGCSGDDGGSAAQSSSTATAGAPRSQGWRVVELEGRPAAAAVSSGGLLVVVDDELGELQRVALDPAQAGAAPEPIGGQLVGLSISPQATWAIDASGTAIHLEEEPLAVDLGGTLVDVVQAQGHVYVGDLEGRRVVELDAGSGAVQRTFAVPAGVVRIAEAGGVLWVTGAERAVTPIDLERGTVRSTVAVGAGPIGLAVADGTVWVANGDDGTVSRLDAATGRRRGDDVRVGSGPIAVAVSGDDVWVLNQDAGTVSHLAASSGDRVEADIPLPRSLSRGRDLVATPTGIAVVGVDASQAAFLPTR